MYGLYDYMSMRPSEEREPLENWSRRVGENERF
jgi:hypothetical protein